MYLCVLYDSRYEQLVFVTETHCVYCEIGTGLMNIAQKFRLQRDNTEGRLLASYFYTRFVFFICELFWLLSNEGSELIVRHPDGVCLCYRKDGCTDCRFTAQVCGLMCHRLFYYRLI